MTGIKMILRGKTEVKQLHFESYCNLSKFMSQYNEVLVNIKVEMGILEWVRLGRHDKCAGKRPLVVKDMFASYDYISGYR